MKSCKQDVGGVTYTKFARLDSLARMVVNFASRGTAVNPIGLPSLAFRPEVNLSTSCTVVGSWGLKNAGGEIQFFLGQILRGGENLHLFSDISSRNIEVPTGDGAVFALPASFDIG